MTYVLSPMKSVFAVVPAVSLSMLAVLDFVLTVASRTMLISPDPEPDTLPYSGVKTMPRIPFQQVLAISQQIIAHWQQVNIALGGTPATDLKLSGAYTIANLTTDRTALQNQYDTVMAAVNALSTSAGTRDILRNNIRIRLTDFRAAVQYALRNTGYVNSLPTLPNKTAGEGRTIQSFADMLTLWTTINADTSVPGFTPPLVLPGAYALAGFTTDFAALRTIYTTYATNTAKARIERDRRDTLLAALYNRLIEYRIAVPAKLGTAHPLAASLPAVTPGRGATPQPVVNPFVVWDSTLNKARVTWEASPSPNITGYEIRFCLALPYRVEDENTVGSVSPDVFTFLTDQNLPAPGSEIFLRIYAQNNTGNEKGSKTLKIVRP